MIHNVALKISGKFDIRVLHADGTHDDFNDSPNLITNQGKDIYGGIYPAGYTGSYGGVGVGTGNAVPSATDTALEIPLAATSNLTAGAESAPSLVAPYATEASGTFTFAVGAVVGNIAEVGLMLNKGTLAATDKVFSRALIMVGGSPGTISVLATDQLIVTYTLTMTYTADTTGSINVTTDGTPVSVNFTARPMALGVNSGIPTNPLSRYVGKLATTGWNVGSNANTAFIATNSSIGSWTNPATLQSSSAYTSGSFTQSFTFLFPTNKAFSAKFYGIEIAGFMNMQILFASNFGPTSVQNMTLQVTYSWS